MLKQFFTPAQFTAAVAALSGRRILVVGDLSLDEYLFGKATRLSREAPIPVLEWLRRETILGGAANPARNIVALGSAAAYIGVVGDDEEGQQARAALEAAGIDARGLVVSDQRPTTRKTRILADESPRLPQQVARIDRVSRQPLTGREEDALIAAIEAALPSVEAVICSDYRLGVLSTAVIEAIRVGCLRHGVLFTVDAQGNAEAYHHADLFRCNDVEAAAAIGRPLANPADVAAGVAELQSRLAAELVIVTRGPAGLALLGRATPYTQIAASQLSEVYDTTGAGDTFIAVAALGLAARLPAPQAAALANLAAGHVVRRFGNAVVTPPELLSLGEPYW